MSRLISSISKPACARSRYGTASTSFVVPQSCLHRLPTSRGSEIENDLALVMEPRSKFERLVLTGRLVEAGMTLVVEAETFARHDLARARAVRNGLMIAL